MHIYLINQINSELWNVLLVFYADTIVAIYADIYLY